MAGLKFVNNELFCDECGSKVNESHKYCYNCGAPLTLDSSFKVGEEDIEHIDKFLDQVFAYSEEEKVSLEKAIKTIRKEYEE